MIQRLALVYIFLWVGLCFTWSLVGDLISISITNDAILSVPSWAHPLGSDALGRDLSTRILEGGSVSFGIGFLASALSLVVAVIFGVGLTWFRPQSKLPLLLLDVFQSLPTYVVSTLIFLLVVRIFPNQVGSFWGLVVSLGFSHWVNPARLLRARTLQLVNSKFVEASESLGAHPWQILKTHFPKHLRSYILVLWSFQIPVILMYESFMSFIGFGIESPLTSWGLLMQEGWRYLSDYPHLLLAPGLVLFTVLISMNYILEIWRGRWSQISGTEIEPPKADSRAAATEIVKWSSP